MKHKVLCIFLSLTFFIPTASFSASSGKRPKIGLVLGGGGARGGAHVGVLKVLEELRIPVDFIAGTSAGSIIGGMYASGYTPSEIEDILINMDWARLVSDSKPREELFFRRKEDQYDFLLPQKLGIKDGAITLPKSALGGEFMRLTLRKLLAPVVMTSDFDDLPIPFRAVSLDVFSGEEAILGEGDLPKAIRSSMSLPGVFPPVEWEDMLLVDGGLLNNVPIDVVREMGADILIVVDVGTPKKTREEMNNALDYFSQATSAATSKKPIALMASLSKKDVLIKADPPVDMADFPQFPNAIPTGQDSAEAVKEMLQRYSLSETEYKKIRESQLKKRLGKPVVDQIELINESKLSDRFIMNFIHAETGKVLNGDQIERDLADLYGLGYFERVDYFIELKENKNTLFIHVREKSWGSSSVQFGLRLVDDLQGSSYFTLASRVNMTQVNKKGAEVRMDFKLGQTNEVSGEFYQPLSMKPGWFVLPKLKIQTENEEKIVDGHRKGIDRYYERLIGLESGRFLGLWGKGVVGYNRAWVRTRNLLGETLREDNDDKEAEVYAEMRLDKLDNLNFPTGGSLGSLRGSASRENLGADKDYEVVEGIFFVAKTFKKTTLTAALEGGSGFDETLPPFRDFELGGLFRLSGYRIDELRGSHLALARILVYQKINKKGMPFYAGASLEAGNNWLKKEDVKFDSLIPAGSVFLGLNSPLGPVIFGYGHADAGRWSWYFTLGRKFPAQ